MKLFKTTEYYRCATEEEASNFIESEKERTDQTIVKYTTEYRCAKQKGEIVDEWYRVTLTKEISNEKDMPTGTDPVKVKYLLTALVQEDTADEYFGD